MKLFALFVFAISIQYLLYGSLAIEIRSRRGKYPRLQLWRYHTSDVIMPQREIQHKPDDFYMTNLFTSFGISPEASKSILKDAPYILTLDIDQQVIPKLQFLKNSILKKLFPWLSSMNYHDDKLDYLESFTSFFGTNLEKVIAPRVGYILCQGVDIDSPEKLLDLVLNFSDEEFSVGICQSSVDDFIKFRLKIWNGGLAAIREGDYDILKLLLDLGWNPIDDIDRTGRTPLMWASALGQQPHSLDIIKLLYEFNTSCIHDVSSTGENAMIWAAAGKSLDICQYLYGKGCNPYLANYELNYPLHWAAGSGSLEILKWLVEDLGVDLNLKNVFGCSVVHFACSGGQVEICKYLLEKECNFLENNSHGHDGITKAIAFKKNNVVRWLLETIPSIHETLLVPRPWTSDTLKSCMEPSMLSLIEIANIVGNEEGKELILLYARCQLHLSQVPSNSGNSN